MSAEPGECPGSGQLPKSIIEAWDFDHKGICPVCGLRCGLMLNEDIGKEVIKPHDTECDHPDCSRGAHDDGFHSFAP